MKTTRQHQATKKPSVAEIIKVKAARNCIADAIERSEAVLKDPRFASIIDFYRGEVSGLQIALSILAGVYPPELDEEAGK